MTPKRTDANQKIIVEALRRIGCSVYILSGVGHGCPDLLVGTHWQDPPLNVLLEVKMGDEPLTEDERAFFETWQGLVYIVRSPEQAIKIVRG